MTERSDELTARRELLEFQIEELQEFNLESNYLQQLELEQQNLANAEQIIQDSQKLLAISDQNETFNLRDGFNQSLSILSQLKHKPEALEEAEQLLQSGLIQVDEAVRCIEQHIDRFEANPHRLQQIEDELGLIFQLARKHRVDSYELGGKLDQLRLELEQLTAGDQNLEALQQQVDQYSDQYKKAATELSFIRQQGALKMSEQINRQLQQLSMEGAELLVQLTPMEENNFKSCGLEEIEFLISTNPGQVHKPLAKVASGGELSRVSLAIQVVAAANSIPTMVFDEVDVGIGGSTADIVGELLKQLGSKGQVISVTHQPQVAAHAHQHYVVSKITENSSAESNIDNLNKAQRLRGTGARMLESAKVTEQTLSHASELFDLAQA